MKNRIYIETMKQFGFLIRWTDNRVNKSDDLLSSLEITILFVTITVWL